MTQRIKAWHFTSGKLRDGRPLPPDGEVLRHDGPLVMCQSGLHASRRAIDALGFAPGSIVCRVDCGGEIEDGNDKIVCSERVILWRLDVTDVLWDFGRRCALDVIHLWDAPEIVIRYLKTGDGSLRAAAGDAAKNAGIAVWAVAGIAARSASWNAAGNACDDARDAAWTKQNRRLTQMIVAAHRAKQ